MDVKKWCSKLLLVGHSVVIPSFHGQSYISYHLPRLQPNALTVSLTFKLWSRTNAVLFSTVQRFRNKHKYLQISVVDNYVVLKYDLGDGVVIVKSTSQVVVGKWIKVYVEQKRKYASMAIDNGQAHKSSSTGPQQSLHLNAASLVYIGASRYVNNSGLQGCIRELILNSQSVDLSTDFVHAYEYGSCFKYTSPCLSQPCLHNSSCVTTSNEEFVCVCPLDYKGDYCEIKVKTCGQFPECVNGGACKEGKYSFFLLVSIGLRRWILWTR